MQQTIIMVLILYFDLQVLISGQHLDVPHSWALVQTIAPLLSSTMTAARKAAHHQERFVVTWFIVVVRWKKAD